MRPRDLDGFGASYAAAWSSGEPDRLAACYAPDGWLKVNDGATGVAAGAALAQTARSYMAAIPAMKVTCMAITAHGEGAIFEWALSSTTARGLSVGARGREVLTFAADGAIATSLGSFDTEDFMDPARGGELGVCGPSGARDRREPSFG